MTTLHLVALPHSNQLTALRLSLFRQLLRPPCVPLRVTSGQSGQRKATLGLTFAQQPKGRHAIVHLFIGIHLNLYVQCRFWPRSAFHLVTIDHIEPRTSVPRKRQLSGASLELRCKWRHIRSFFESFVQTFFWSPLLVGLAKEAEYHTYMAK